MLEDQINNEVRRLSTAAGSPPPKKKRVEGLVEYSKEPIGRRIFDALFEGDLKTVASSIVYEIMIPKTKDLLADIFIGGIEKAIYGDDSAPARTTKSGGSHKASYDAYYSNGRYYTQPPKAAPVKQKVRWNYIVMKTRPRAVELLNDLRNDISRYGKVSVTELYDYVTEIDEELGAQIESEFPDSNWGWNNLDRVSIEHVRDGYWIKLPKPVDIN